MDWLWFWLIMAFVGNFIGFSLLKRIPKFKHSFGTKEHEWLVNAVWDVALLFVPFLLTCNSLLTPRIKYSLLLNACLNFICLAFPAVIEHLYEYPGFHIDVNDMEQHNSLKRIELFAAFSFASTSFGLSKAYDLTFESGFFFLCLGYAMKVSLEIIDRNGNRNPAFISVTYSFCFMVILLRKYLEKNNGSNTTRQDNQSLDSTNRADQSPNNNGGADQNLSATSNADLQGRENVPLVILAPDQTRPHEMSMPNLNGSRENVSGSQRDLRQESWEINEQNWESVPPRLYNDTSTEDAEEEDEEDVPSVSNFVVKEGRGFIITRPEINNHFVEETSSANDDSVDNIEEREVPGLGTRNEEQDMRSTASSSHRKIVGSTGLHQGTRNICAFCLMHIEHINNDFDAITCLLRQFFCSGSSNIQLTTLPVWLRCEICLLLGSTQQRMQRKFINPVSESLAPRAKISELSDDEGSYVDDLIGRAGSKNGVGQRGMNKCTVKVIKDITNLDESQLANKSFFRLPSECSTHGIHGQISKTLVPVEIIKHYELLSTLANGSFFRLPRECWTHRDFVQTWATPELAEINKLSELLSTSTNRSFLGLPSKCWDKNIVSVQTSTTPTLAEISEPSNDDNGDSHDEGHDGCDFNTGMGCIPGVGQRGKKKHPLKEGKHSSNFNNFTYL